MNFLEFFGIFLVILLWKIIIFNYWKLLEFLEIFELWYDYNFNDIGDTCE